MATVAAAPAAPPAMKKENANFAGWIGLIVSLLGAVFTLGFLCPLGFIVSCFGLRHRRKGAALAGLLVGVLGSISAVTLVVLLAIMPEVIYAHLGLGAGDHVESDALGATEGAFAAAQQKINVHRVVNGALPGADEGARLIADIEDGWGTPLKYVLLNGEYRIRSAGEDRKFGTTDDKEAGMIARDESIDKPVDLDAFEGGPVIEGLPPLPGGDGGFPGMPADGVDFSPPSLPEGNGGNQG